MSNQEERQNLIDKFKRLEPFYQQYMDEDYAFRNYQYYLANREHNRHIINNLQQYIESEHLEKKVKLVESIRGTGWKRSKYVLSRSIALLFVFWSCWLNFGIKLIREFLPFDLVYIQISSNSFEFNKSLLFYCNIFWIFISLIFSILLPLYYYNKNKLGKTITKYDIAGYRRKTWFFL